MDSRKAFMNALTWCSPYLCLCALALDYVVLILKCTQDNGSLRNCLRKQVADE